MEARRRTIDDLLAEARASLLRIEPAEAYAAVQGGTLLVDTRSDDQRAESGSIPGALHIPLSVLEWRLDPDSPYRDPAIPGIEQPLIVICAHGFSSSLAARRLQDIGFSHATDVIGGFEGWKAAGLPVTAPGDARPGHERPEDSAASG